MRTKVFKRRRIFIQLTLGPEIKTSIANRETGLCVSRRKSRQKIPKISRIRYDKPRPILTSDVPLT